ncbi:MAG: glycoside hydrolase family 3 protein [Cytophagaceae bacterium]|nr:glycoside hydrolase family 3 protein [Cytophagaceae bacterium]
MHLFYKLTLLTFSISFLLSCHSKQPVKSNEVTADKKQEKETVKKEQKEVSHRLEDGTVIKKTNQRKINFTLEEKIGQMIMMGINERKLIEEKDELRQEIIRGKTGGIIYFEKNISPTYSKDMLKKMSMDLQALAKVPLFISIDEEGGKVHRLKEKYGMIKMPSAEYLGKLNDLDSTIYYNKQLASLMSEVGINLNFAPDVDLALNVNNPVIAKVGRSYGADPDLVSRHAIACIKAHHEYNVKTVIKHFPGHGSSATDSHYGITDITKQWQFIELLPYKEVIQSGFCDAVMTAHIVNCRLDTTCLPATLSKVVMTDILRGVMGFNGVIFSDDMQMHAISKNYGLENAIKLSILAGVDVVVFGNNVNQSYRTTSAEVHAIILKLVKSGEISEERINESFQRIMELKEKKFK